MTVAAVSVAGDAASAGTSSWQRTSWRATTALRVFVLAMGVGSVMGERRLGESLPVLAGLILVASVCSSLEWRDWAPRTAWVPVAEAISAGILLFAGPTPWGLVVYLVLPPLIAGVHHGWVWALNAGVISAITIFVCLDATDAPVVRALTASLPWMLMGIAIGVLAAWWTRSVRDLETRQAPYAAAHRLMAQLHELTQRGDVGLDSTMLAQDLVTAIRATTGADAVAVLAHGPRGALVQIASHGETTRLAAYVQLPLSHLPTDALVVHLRGGPHIAGSVVATRPGGWPPSLKRAAQEVADDFALRVDTAVLFDDVRLLAAAEERNRIAREMHDGVAQEVVALGFLVDELDAVADTDEARALTAELRSEITRLVTELRFSIFDLRQQVSEHRLSGALTDYIHGVSSDTDLRVHLVLDETGPPLSPRTEAELLRIAQEAVGNVRKHAQAHNLWVTFASDGAAVRLQVEDDGVGGATPRQHHWGLQTMRERAATIGARLSIEPRPGGGTIVSLRTEQADPQEGPIHDHLRAADR